MSKEVFINELLGRFSQLFLPRKTLRMGYDNLGDKCEMINQRKKSIVWNFMNRTKFIGTFAKKFQIQQYEQSHPDWIESRYTTRPSGFLIPSLVITDNNIGLVTIYSDYNNNIQRISHKLLVLKGGSIKIHETIL